jgi:hypothetical protein
MINISNTFLSVTCQENDSQKSFAILIMECSGVCKGVGLPIACIIIIFFKSTNDLI